MWGFMLVVGFSVWTLNFASAPLTILSGTTPPAILPWTIPLMDNKTCDTSDTVLIHCTWTISEPYLPNKCYARSPFCIKTVTQATQCMFPAWFHPIYPVWVCWFSPTSYHFYWGQLPGLDGLLFLFNPIILFLYSLLFLSYYLIFFSSYLLFSV